MKKYDIRKYIMDVFHRTGEDGTVELPEFWYDADEPDHKLSCTLKWTAEDAKKLGDEASRLMEYFAVLGPRYDELEDMTEDELIAVLPKDQVEVWCTYRPLFLQEDYAEDMLEIWGKIDNIEYAADLLKRQAEGEELDEDEREIVAEYGNASLTADEQAQLEWYRNLSWQEASLRIGKGLCALNAVLGGSRICKLISLSAPEIIIEKEIEQFANALILHRFGEQIECIPL